MTKDRIVAFVDKPIGRGENRYWKAFSFSPNAHQNDIEAFMCYIHVPPHKYFLAMQSHLERVKPYKGSPNQRTIFYRNDSIDNSRVFVNDTPVSLLWEKRKEDGKVILSRLFKVR